MSPNDTALLRRWCECRDAEAFNELVERYAGLVFATAHRILGSGEDAREVTQDCFLRLTGERPGLQNELGAWLHRLAT